VRLSNGVRLRYVPGVYFPGQDSCLLAEAIAAERVTGSDVLDICTGSGFLAITAAKLGARSVTAVDISWRAVAGARMNAALNRVRVQVRRGHLLGAVPKHASFDLIVTNPPWVPAAADALPAGGRARAWDAGQNGRLLLDQICRVAASWLRPGGVLLAVHGSVCGTRRTEELLAAQGLAVSVPARAVQPMTTLIQERAATLSSPCRWGPGEGTYELVVVRGKRPRARAFWSVLRLSRRWHRPS
jgi:release factor glutamine methyltransferase